MDGLKPWLHISDLLSAIDRTIMSKNQENINNLSNIINHLNLIVIYRTHTKTAGYTLFTIFNQEKPYVES